LKPVAVWARRFDNPIPLPGGRELLTLCDAGDCITSLPKAEQDLEEWLVVELNGPTMMARIGVLRALNRHVVRVFNPDRKDTLGEAQAEEGPMTTRSVLATDRNA
jgi:hypothetical protein